MVRCNDGDRQGPTTRAPREWKSVLVGNSCGGGILHALGDGRLSADKIWHAVTRQGCAWADRHGFKETAVANCSGRFAFVAAPVQLDHYLEGIGMLKLARAVLSHLVNAAAFLVITLGGIAAGSVINAFQESDETKKRSAANQSVDRR
jgi:hypothetical protein